jgi:N-methylhydantoinase A/oxoprolinase/acetone carboxylase beta subunit
VVAIDIRTIALGGDSQIHMDDEGRLRVGPRRIIPLSYLGYVFPQVHEELKRIEEDRKVSSWRSPTDFWIRVGEKTEEGIDPLTGRILDEVTRKPRSLFQLVRATDSTPSDVLRRLAYLERRNLIQKAGVTPTDVLHLTGIFQAWDRDAAERGLRILCDQWKIDFPTLVQQLEETMDRSMGMQILQLLLSESVSSSKEWDDCRFCRLFLDESFRRKSALEGLRFKIQLRDKIIGIGAPAHAFLPSVAEKMGTQAVIPFFAGVANAVGAVTSAIVIQAEIFIKPFQAGFRLHPSLGPSCFDDLGEATEEAKKRLREEVHRKAKGAGADAVEVVLDEKEHWATARGGDSIFIEKIVQARALGNPRMYSEGSLK